MSTIAINYQTNLRQKVARLLL